VLARAWTPTPGRPLSFTPTLAEVAAICRAYGVRDIFIDQYNAQPAREALQRHGLYPTIVPTTPQSKSEMFTDLRTRIYEGAIELYRHEDLLAEFGLLETVTTPGRATVRSRRVAGSHGDLVTALALAASKMRPDNRIRMRTYLTDARLPTVEDRFRRGLVTQPVRRRLSPRERALRRLGLSGPQAARNAAIDARLADYGVDSWSVTRGQAELDDIMRRGGGT
jgi:hypothetical protein